MLRRDWNRIRVGKEFRTVMQKRTRYYSGSVVAGRRVIGRSGIGRLGIGRSHITSRLLD